MWLVHIDEGTMGIDLPDAVAVLQVLEPNLPLTDVGTGSGTPGMLVACMLPDTEVLLASQPQNGPRFSVCALLSCS